MDSICAAVGYAELKRLTGHKNVIAGRAGSTNERIDFVLNKFGVEAPVLVNDLAPRVRDVMHRDMVSISKDSSVYDAVQVIEQSELRGLPGKQSVERLRIYHSFASMSYLALVIDQEGPDRRATLTFARPL
jgi:manganese-dependent inorganic pyrophosphatase